MLINTPVPLLDLVSNKPEATNLTDLKINDHSKRVTFIALNISSNIIILTELKKLK